MIWMSPPARSHARTAKLECQRLVVTDGARGTAERIVPPTSDGEPVQTLAGLLRPVAVAAFHLGASGEDLRLALEEAMRGIFDQRAAL